MGRRWDKRWELRQGQPEGETQRGEALFKTQHKSELPMMGNPVTAGWLHLGRNKADWGIWHGNKYGLELKEVAKKKGEGIGVRRKGKKRRGMLKSYGSNRRGG